MDFHFSQSPLSSWFSLSSCVIVFFSFVLLVGFSNVYGQSVYPATPDSVLLSDVEPHPNTIPYSSSRSVVGHILAFPSYIFEWTTKPLDWGLKATERKLPQLLQGERGSYGIYPLFELGGDTDFAYGFLGFHNAVTKNNHKLRLEVIFGSEDYNNFEIDYTIPSFISENGSFEIDAFYGNDPSVSLFMGNDAELDDRFLYATEKIEASLSYKHKFQENIGFSFTPGYYSLNVSSSDVDVGNLTDSEFDPIPTSLTGTTALFSADTKITFDLAKGTPRINTGSRYSFGLNWQHSLTNNNYHFIEYSAEWNQFVPVFFLPYSRRLAFKGVVRKAESLGDKSIPFFAEPSLGGSSDLRGFATNRFQDTGSLLLTLEYRYPMWNFADIVLFVDEGQVFNRYSDITFKGFHTNYGAGVHFLSAKGFAFRGEYAVSSESSRLILAINKNF